MSKNEKKPDFTKLSLRHDFTRSEKIELSQTMARLFYSKGEAENELKSVKSDFKSRIDGFDEKIANVVRKINDGFEMREHDCEVVKDWNVQRVFYYYPNFLTGELVKERRMGEDEIQQHIWDEKNKKDDQDQDPDVVKGESGEETPQDEAGIPDGSEGGPEEEGD